MTESQRGVLAMVAACVIWGLSTLYYKLLDHVPPVEVLAHRTLWSLAFFGMVLAVQRRLRQVGVILGNPRSALLVAFAGLCISSNWFFFIWSVQIGRAVEASLGYYIFPLVAVAMGALLLREALTPVKWVAVAMVALAVIGLTLALGVTPWVSLLLAGTFALYGLAKRRVTAGPVVSVTTEVLMLAPLALIWLVGVHGAGWVGGGTGPDTGEGAVFLANARDTWMLMLAGPLTAGPLILFSYAAKRVTYATIGLVQYLNPTLQFLVATLIFMEPFGLAQGLAFAVIWAALALYSAEVLRQERIARRRVTSSGISPTSSI